MSSPRCGWRWPGAGGGSAGCRFATAAFDVTATTLVLVLLAVNHLPAGLNSLIVWCGYLLAILLTALRSDGRITLFAGALALLQYGLLIWLVFALAASPEQLISSDYGSVTVGNQVQRWCCWPSFTLVTATVVYRMQRLVEMSGTDGLTRLPNRTWLLHRIPRLFDARASDGGSLTLALIDLDHFKRINDEIGHHAGDRALLPRGGGAAGRSAEPGEWLVRLGGEEFVMLLRKPMGTAGSGSTSIRRAVAERPFEPERSADPIRSDLQRRPGQLSARGRRPVAACCAAPTSACSRPSAKAATAWSRATPDAGTFVATIAAACRRRVACPRLRRHRCRRLAAHRGSIDGSVWRGWPSACLAWRC